MTGFVPAQAPLLWGHVWEMLWLSVSLGSAAVAGSLPGWRVFGDRAVLINGALSSSFSVWQAQWPGLGLGWVFRAP